MPESIVGRTQILPDDITAQHLYALLVEIKNDIEALRTFATTHIHAANNTPTSTSLGSQNLLS